MMKLMIIMWIVTICLFVLLKTTPSRMSDEEIYDVMHFDVYPKRVLVLSTIFTFSLIASIVITIITIVRW